MSMAGETARMSRLCHFTTATLLLVLCSITGALADDPIRFLYPNKEGLEFHYLDRIDISYESNFSAPFLFTWCGQGNAQLRQQDRPDGGNATTEITLQFESDDDLQNDCWFNLRIHDLGDSSPLGANSKAFTYLHVTREGGPATLGLPSATATSVSTPTASSLTNVTATITSSATPAPSGLSTGAKAGIGVGAAVGAIAVAAAAGAFIFRRRKRARRDGLRRTDTRDVGGRTSPGLYPELQGHEHAAEMGGMGAYKGKYAPVAPGSPQEMPADHHSPEIERHELPAGLDGSTRDEGNFRS